MDKVFESRDRDKSKGVRRKYPTTVGTLGVRLVDVYY